MVNGISEARRMPWPPGGGGGQISGGGHGCIPQPGVGVPPFGSGGNGGNNQGGGIGVPPLGGAAGGVKPGSPADVGGGPGKHAPGTGPGAGNGPFGQDGFGQSSELTREKMEQMMGGGGGVGNVAEMFRTQNS